jgi:hypothetical protein
VRNVGFSQFHTHVEAIQTLETINSLCPYNL